MHDPESWLPLSTFVNFSHHAESTASIKALRAGQCRLAKRQRHDSMSSFFRHLGEALGMRPAERFSVDYLRWLLGVMETNPDVTPSNVDRLVETIREISELVTWADRHNPAMTEFFMEKRMLERMLGYLDTARPIAKPVKVQILQTLGIFFQNISDASMVFYLLSNDRINALITHRFDFDDEELMAYYISFIKALSLRMNEDTVHFFFNPDKSSQFPLLTEALKFYQHDDHMVRVAVRTLSLNVYRLDDPRMRLFIAEHSAVPFFSNLTWEMIRRYREMCALVFEVGGLFEVSEVLPARQRFERLLLQQTDDLYYLNDVLNCDFPALKTIVCSRLLHKLLVPLCFVSLEQVPRLRACLLSPASLKLGRPVEFDNSMNKLTCVHVGRCWLPALTVPSVDAPPLPAYLVCTRSRLDRICWGCY